MKMLPTSRVRKSNVLNWEISKELTNVLHEGEKDYYHLPYPESTSPRPDYEHTGKT